jgi:hypothetical protein
MEDIGGGQSRNPGNHIQVEMRELPKLKGRVVSKILCRV